MTTKCDAALDWPHLDEWLTAMCQALRLGPGCGSAEFEGPRWREEVTWRMLSGLRPGLIALYRRWLSERDAK
jgi:hypothetical protein